ncbi:MAG: histidinol-phosphatase HisJ family protein [Coriobacteriia bacterium]
MIDLHVHTARCRHATGSVEEYVQAARAAQIDTIAFTDHLPLPASLLQEDPHAVEYAMPEDELPAYIAEVLEAQERARAAGGPEVLLGVEADLHQGNADHVRSLLARHPFDVVLGSVHYLDGWAFDDPARTERYASWNLTDLWERYFADVVAAAESGVADVMAHVDLIKKFCFVPDTDLGPLYRRTATALAAADAVVEVNAAGLRKPCGELYPSDTFLGELARAGVRVSMGSDAHSPGDVGMGLTQARAALLRAGFENVVVFRGRVPWEESL